MAGTRQEDPAEPAFGRGPRAGPGSAPPPGAAIDHEPTRRALAGHGRRALLFVGGGLVLAVVAAALLVALVPEGRGWSSLAGAAVSGPVLAAWLTLRWRWMRSVLRTSPWVSRRGEYHVVRGLRLGGPPALYATLVLEADEHGPEVQCAVPELRWRMDALAAPGGPIQVWIAGDPARRAVATLDGSEIVPIARRRWSWWRGHIARKIERQGTAAPDAGAATRRS